jgi:hypothetical protein
MEKCKDNYEEGQRVSYQGIMLKAERKYQDRVMNNKCNTLTSEQEQIIALKAQISSISPFKPKKKSPTKKRIQINGQTQLSKQDQALPGTKLGKTRSPYFMNPKSKLSMD